MFILHRLHAAGPRTVRPLFLRTNATLSTGSAVPEAPSPPLPPLKSIASEAKQEAQSEASSTEGVAEGGAADSKTQGRRRRKGIPTSRPPISNEQPRKWNRPLRERVVPAYDCALNYLKEDSLELQGEATGLREKIDGLEKELVQLKKSEHEGREEGVEQLDEELEKLREKLNIIEVQSEINLPDVRWKVANAMVDMSKPVHRHLVEQKWRNEGDLDLLMERIFQMKVVPDVLPELNPSFDLHVVARTLHSEFLKTKKVQKEIEPGVYVFPKQTLNPPKLYANVFHTDTRLYTMLLVDPDVPDEENGSYATFLHWLKPNIPLSASHTSRILNLNNHTQYIPPHPQRGTPYHRYVLLFLPQPPLEGSRYTRNIEARAQPGVPTSQHLDIPVVPIEQRTGFNVRQFAKEWNLKGKKGGGVHMWREIWDEEVSRIYSDMLETEEPRYGLPPKFDRYAEVKSMKKYIS